VKGELLPNLAHRNAEKMSVVLLQLSIMRSLYRDFYLKVNWNHQHETTENSVEGQMRKALDNLKIVLAAAGSSVGQLLQVRVYVRGELGEHMETVVPILSGFLGESRPSVTGIGVASLASPSTLVEVEAVASVREVSNECR
jgi:2-iminobutanoate/2-iminopropanoate deaminase